MFDTLQTFIIILWIVILAYIAFLLTIAISEDVDFPKVFYPFVRKNKKKLFFIFASTILFILFLNSLVIVKEGQVAVISRHEIPISIRENGVSFKLPFIDKKNTFSINEQLMKVGTPDPLVIPLKDLDNAKAIVTISFHINDPTLLYSSAKSIENAQMLLLPRLKDLIQTDSSKYTKKDFLLNKENFIKDISNQLEPILQVYGIAINQVFMEVLV